MTNGDRIRSMTNDELTQFFLPDDSNVCMHCREKKVTRCDYPECNLIHRHDVFKKWLSSESEAMRY